MTQQQRRPLPAWAELVRDFGGPTTAIVAIAFIVRLDATVASVREELTQLRGTISAIVVEQRDLAVEAARTRAQLEALDRAQRDDTAVRQAGGPR